MMSKEKMTVAERFKKEHPFHYWWARFQLKCELFVGFLRYVVFRQRPKAKDEDDD
jgi:hypothetical protein